LAHHRKNPIFHKLQNSRYGLKEWYPAIKDGKTRTSSTPASSPDHAPEQGNDFDFEEREHGADLESDQKEPRPKKQAQT
jgi:hypothetical protein